MQIITPIDITDEMLNSPIAEPDTSQGEVSWENRTIPTISAPIDTTRNNGMCVTDDGTIYYVGDGIYYINSSGVQVEIDYIATDSFYSCVHHEGFVYTIERDGGDIYIVDTSDNSIQVITGATDKRAGQGVYGGDGYVYFCSDGFLIAFEVSTQTVTYKAIDDEGDQFNSYDIILGIDGNLYMTGLNAVDFTYKVISYSAISDANETISDVALAGQALAQGTDGLIYSAGRGTVAATNPETGSVSFFGVMGGVIVSMATISNGDIIALGQSSSGYAKISVIDTDNQTVSSTVESTGSISRIRGSVSYGDKTWFCGNDGLTGSILNRYTVGEQAILSSTHSVYQSVINTYDSPDVGSLLVPPSWVELYATNKYRMFDYVISTVTSSSLSSVQISVPEKATTVSLYGLSNIASIRLAVREDDLSGELLYNKTNSLELDLPEDDLISNEYLYNSKTFFDDVPVYDYPYLALNITRIDDSINWEIGDIVIGNPRTLGRMTYLSSTSRTSYDTVETDDYGNETTISRPSAEYTTFEMVVFPQYTDYVERILKDSLNKPRVYVGDKQGGEKMFTFGYYERSPISYDDPSLCTTTLKVRGLV